MNEVWKELNDRYSVSNLGNVKSNYANKERVLKSFKDVKGYLKVDLRSPGERKSIPVHRLVAMAFIPNPDNLPQVNHKDENKTNNCVDNLEWCDNEYNSNYGTRNQRKAEHCQKAVYSIDNKSGAIFCYDSVKEAGELTGVHKTSISKVLKGTHQNKTAGGKRWFYD